MGFVDHEHAGAAKTAPNIFKLIGGDHVQVVVQGRPQSEPRPLIRFAIAPRAAPAQ